MNLSQTLIQFAVFQITWIVAALGYQWFGTELWMWPALVGLLLTLVWSPVPIKSIAIALVAGISLGVLMDGVLSLLGIYAFPEERATLPHDWIPLWLVVMWCAFVTTLMGSALWLLNKPVPFLLASAVMGPLSYFVGMQLGIIQFELSSLPIMVVGWAIWAAMFSAIWQWLGVTRVNQTEAITQ